MGPLPLGSSLNARSKDDNSARPWGGLKAGGYPGTGLFWGRRLGGWGGRGGGGALLSWIPGWAGLLCWLKASITLGVFATGGGGVGARGSAEREKERKTEGQASSHPQPSHQRLSGKGFFFSFF